MTPFLRIIRVDLFTIIIIVWSFSTAQAQQPTGGAKLIQTIDFKNTGGCPGLRLGDINGDGKYENCLSSGYTGKATATIWNLQGRVLFEGHWDIRKERLFLKNNFYRGIYIISVSVDNRQKTGKIIVE